MKEPIFKCNITLQFSKEKELIEGFSLLGNYIAKKQRFFPDTEVTLKLEWTPQTLKKFYHKLVINQIRLLHEKCQKLSVVNFFPFCLNDEGKYSTFPDCQSCVFYEAQWCMWPRHTKECFISPQMDLDFVDSDHIQPANFDSKIPLTWMTPEKKYIQLVAKVFALFDTVIDFGCGNGFISSLVLQEGLDNRYIGVDPYVTPKLKHKSFTHLKELPTLTKPFALFSSQADTLVPLDSCFQKALPHVVTFFLLPELFGRGGEQAQLTYQQGELTIIEETSLFDISKFEQRDYQLTHRERTRSAYWNDTELRIYAHPSVVDKVQKIKIEKEVAPYSWESTSSSNSLTTSESSLS